MARRCHTFCFILLSIHWLSTAAQFSGSGESPTNEHTPYLPDITLSPIPYYVYIPVLLVLGTLIVCTGGAVAGCFSLCYKRLVRRSLTSHVNGHERVNQLESLGNDATMFLNPAYGHDPESPARHSDSRATSLPGTLLASGKHAVSPPPATLPERGKRKAAANLKENCDWTTGGEGDGGRVRGQESFDQESFDQSHRTEREIVISQCEGDTRILLRNQSSTHSIETSPSHRSSVGQGQMFDSMQRVQKVMKPRDTQQLNNEGHSAVFVEETNV